MKLLKYVHTLQGEFIRFKHNNILIETEAWGVPTSHRTGGKNSTWKLPSEAQQAICDMYCVKMTEI